MTRPLQRPARRGLTPDPLTTAMQRIESAAVLDAPVRRLTAVADRVLASDRAARCCGGSRWVTPCTHS